MAANVEGPDDKPILPPYIIENVGSQKIAFIGVVTRTTPTIVSPAGVAGLKFTDEAAAINKYVAELKTLGILSIVAVVHEGGVTDSTWNDKTCANARGEIFNIADKQGSRCGVVWPHPSGLQLHTQRHSGDAGVLVWARHIPA